VRKRVTPAPDRPSYVLGTRAKSRLARSAILERLRTGVKFPGETLVVDVGVPNRAWHASCGP
jgi:hypothetical protein